MFKKIYLIELFAGIGSQARALKNLGINVVHHRVIEYDKYAISSYNAIHSTNFFPIDIRSISGYDLGINNTHLHTYLLTYSFPCQDLSLVGKQAGMRKSTGTRSCLLWEVERLLNESAELPQYLLLENVPQIHSKKNIVDFKLWQKFLEEKGYINYWQDLNSMDYGIPQNRNRCFMISIRKDIDKGFDFLKPFELDLCLNDFLESYVDDKYFLSDKMIKYISSVGTKNFKNSNCKINLDIARPLTTHQNKRAGTTNYISSVLPSNFDLKFISPHDDLSALAIRRLTPKECWRLMGFTDYDFYKVSQLCSDFQLYKQAGNSIVVNVLESIFLKLFY